MGLEKKTNFSGKDRELLKELEDTFPASDPPSITQPGGGITGAEKSIVGKDRVERIRERAHAIWLDEGQCHGRDDKLEASRG